MEQIPFSFLQNMGWAGVAGLSVWVFGRPLMKRWIARQNGTSTNVMDKLEQLEKNDMKHFQATLDHFSNVQDSIRKDVGELKIKVAVLETKVNRK
ncbi:MAG: hypothetical protein IH935_08575 [Acidobacteria bacterium]|nr:hypothetical protein [Acidobacteriota bacterium]